MIRSVSSFYPVNIVGRFFCLFFFFCFFFIWWKFSNVQKVERIVQLIPIFSSLRFNNILPYFLLLIPYTYFTPNISACIFFSKDFHVTTTPWSRLITGAISLITFSTRFRFPQLNVFIADFSNWTPVKGHAIACSF